LNGVIAVIAAKILKVCVEEIMAWDREEKLQVKWVMETGSAVLIYMITLAVLHKFTHQYMAIFW